MAVPANICVAWPSTAASIPSGWTRVTELDSRFVQGAATGADTDLTTDRGNLTHTHTSPAHTPLQNPHQTGVGSDIFGGTTCANGTGTSLGPSHSHSGTSPDVTATNQSSTVNFNANSSNDPPFVAVIWIKSDGTPVGIPNAAYAYFDSDTLPTGWSRVQAGNYLKGAVAAGDGGTTGGAATHTHVSDSHTHVQDPHTHADFTSGNDTGLVRTPLDTGVAVLKQPHTHQLSVGTATATNQATTNTSSAVSHEPVNKKLNIIQNGGSDNLPSSVIALYLGTNASIPSGWARYTALDGFFPKGAAAGESGSTGGSQTHTHTAVCQPTQNAHTHSITGDSGSPLTGSGTDISSGATVRETETHNHVWTDFGTVATNQALTYNVDACSSEAAYPKYRRVIFVQFSAAPPVQPHVLTSYDTGLFPGEGMNREDVGPVKFPERLQAIWRGDRRQY